MSRIPGLISALSKMAPSIAFIAALAAPIDAWRRFKLEFSNCYHPELHYMRGPGPKWREKHAHHVSMLSVSRHI
jgi:hypothetical protein